MQLRTDRVEMFRRTTPREWIWLSDSTNLQQFLMFSVGGLWWLASAGSGSRRRQRKVASSKTTKSCWRLWRPRWVRKRWILMASVSCPASSSSTTWLFSNFRSAKTQLSRLCSTRNSLEAGSCWSERRIMKSSTLTRLKSYGIALGVYLRMDCVSLRALLLNFFDSGSLGLIVGFAGCAVSLETASRTSFTVLPFLSFAPLKGFGRATLGFTFSFWLSIFCYFPVDLDCDLPRKSLNELLLLMLLLRSRVSSMDSSCLAVLLKQEGDAAGVLLPSAFTRAGLDCCAAGVWRAAAFLCTFWRALFI